MYSVSQSRGCLIHLESGYKWAWRRWLTVLVMPPVSGRRIGNMTEDVQWGKEGNMTAGRWGGWELQIDEGEQRPEVILCQKKKCCRGGNIPILGWGVGAVEVGGVQDRKERRFTHFSVASTMSVSPSLPTTYWILSMYQTLMLTKIIRYIISFNLKTSQGSKHHFHILQMSENLS